MKPSNTSLASLMQPIATAREPVETDALIIGAGPVGLFQTFELGLQGIRSHVIDALPHAGGQCIELYPDKPIYDIPALPVCTGRELVARLLQQIAPFDPIFHLEQEVCEVARRADGRFAVATSTKQHFLAKTLFIAAGVGAFQARELKIDGLAAHRGSQLFYRLPTDTTLLSNQAVVIVGGGDAALECAIHLCNLESTTRPKRVTLMHRRDAFQASPDPVDAIQKLRAEGRLEFVAAQATGIDETPDGQLRALRTIDSDGLHRDLPVDTLLVFLGLSPKLGPIARWGLDLDHRQVLVDTEKFQTNSPGIFAVGDINTYPGKKKLILSGFHEATLAAFAAAAIIHPDQAAPLQYTTTSTKLHQRLGVTGRPN